MQIVSRETFDKLRVYEALVQKWTKKINLVSAGDYSQIWDRHIVDSLQVYEIAPKEGTWLDIGSGAGFPGIVAAIMDQDTGSDRRFVLVDSDQRKCAFLRAVIRELELNVSVIAERVGEIAPMGVEIMSARALDDLKGLLNHADRHMAPDGIAIFPKGSRWKVEHDEAKQHWSYSLQVIQSNTNANASILKIKELKRV